MVHLIDKDDAVAEIKKRIKEAESMQPKFDQFWAGQISAFKGVLKILDTLEVKEVNLELELANYNREFVDENGFFNTEHLAKHFFELGLQIAQKGE